MQSRRILPASHWWKEFLLGNERWIQLQSLPLTKKDQNTKCTDVTDNSSPSSFQLCLYLFYSCASWLCIKIQVGSNKSDPTVIENVPANFIADFTFVPFCNLTQRQTMTLLVGWQKWHPVCVPCSNYPPIILFLGIQPPQATKGHLKWEDKNGSLGAAPPSLGAAPPLGSRSGPGQNPWWWCGVESDDTFCANMLFWTGFKMHR